MQRQTTTRQIQRAITNNLLKLTKAEKYSKSTRLLEEISTDLFTENFSFLCETGVFMDMIGWHYERDCKTGLYITECGRMNPDTETIVTVYLRVCNDACRENIEKVLEVTEEE